MTLLGRRWRPVPALACALLVACGGAASQDSAVAEVARPVAPAPLAVAEDPPADARPPQDLAMVLRIRDPEDSLDAASLVSGTPLSLLLTIVSQMEELRILGAVDMRAPVDVAVVSPPAARLMGLDDGAPDPTPLAAASFGITSPGRFLEAFPRGASRRPRRDGGVVLAHDDVVCAVPGGRGPARVVCATDEEALRRLSPWMTRTLAAEAPPPVDTHVTLYAAPARQAIRALASSELREEAASARRELEELGVGDPELLAVPGELLQELEAFADDADRLEIALDLDATSRTASAKVTARFRTSSSWAARVLADPSERRGPPPPAFWRLPRDADGASWALATSPRHFTGVRRVLSKAVSFGMSQAGATPDEAAAVVGAIDGVPAIGGSWVSSQGRLPWKTPPKGNPTPQNAVADLKDRARSLLGWGVGSVDGPATAWTAWLGEVDRAWKKGFASARKSMSAEDLAELPDLRVVRGPPGYPAGSVALDVVVKFDSELAWEMSPRVAKGEDGLTQPHPPGAPARGQMTFRLVVVPDGDRTVLGWALDDAALRARVKAVLRDAPASGTLASRGDLKRLERPGTGGGFFSMRPWIDMTLDLASTPENAGDVELDMVRKAVAAMPHGGGTPILTFADGTPGAAPILTFELMVQEGTLEDIRALGQFAMSQGLQDAMKGLSVPPPPP